MNSTHRIILVIAVICIIATALIVVHALESWTQTISGTIPGTGSGGFQVYSNSGFNDVWTSGGTVTLTASQTYPYTEDFYLKNLSNAELTVTPTDTVTVSSGDTVDASWNATSVTLAANGGEATLAFTISSVSGTAGDTFSIAISLT